MSPCKKLYFEKWYKMSYKPRPQDHLVYFHHTTVRRNSSLLCTNLLSNDSVGQNFFYCSWLTVALYCYSINRHVFCPERTHQCGSKKIEYRIYCCHWTELIYWTSIIAVIVGKISGHTIVQLYDSATKGNYMVLAVDFRIHICDFCCLKRTVSFSEIGDINPTFFSLFYT